MADNPLCPYCGPWNGHPDGVEMLLEADEGFKRKEDGTTCIGTIEAWYSCPVCHCNSPFRKTDAEALAVALLRFQPMQKPLTLEEAIEAEYVWMQSLGTIQSGYVRVVLYENKYERVCAYRAGYSEPDMMRAGWYGIIWRCWRTRPTDEERAAAKWEDGKT